MPAPATPTIVPVHGAFAGSASWNGVVGPLLADGYRVTAVADPLRGVERDAQYLAGVLGRTPSWFLFGSDDRNIPAEAHRSMAERARSRRTVEIAGGSHTVAVPEAPAAVELIREAAAVASGER